MSWFDSKQSLKISCYCPLYEIAAIKPVLLAWVSLQRETLQLEMKVLRNEDDDKTSTGVQKIVIFMQFLVPKIDTPPRNT